MQLSCSNVIDSVSCYEASDGNIDLTVSGGVYPYTYLWSNGDTTQDIINLSSNTYIVNILDSNNCLLISNFLLEEPEDLFAFFINLREKKTDEEIYSELDNYEINKLDINRMYRYIDKHSIDVTQITCDDTSSVISDI